LEVLDQRTTGLSAHAENSPHSIKDHDEMNAHQATTLVRTAYGDLEGYEDEDLRILKGIPYASPPVGPRRFRSPAPPESWSGIRPALRSGPASCQMNSVNKTDVMRLVKQMDPGVPGILAWPAYVDKTYDHPVASEDCLYLDIWAPEIEDGRKLPVFLYYHGGANAVSSGSFELERGANLASQEDIIVVRPNYRLGALGWVHFGLISDELAEAVNLGLQDQIAALEWVAANIEAFGGDKDNITIGGESCGATAVSHLMIHPRARTLFKRAIIQSLSPFNLWCTQGRDQAAAVAQKYLDLLGIENPAGLSDVEPNRLLAIQNILTRYLDPDDNVAWRPLGGVVDGNWIPRQPAETLSTAQHPRSATQLMIGFAKDEWQYFRGIRKLSGRDRATTRFGYSHRCMAARAPRRSFLLSRPSIRRIRRAICCPTSWRSNSSNFRRS
jgi:para-nitrobenzyl esterase